MKKQGFDISGERCDAKYKSLRSLYKACKDNNNRSGHGRKTFPYFDVRVLYFKRPDTGTFFKIISQPWFANNVLLEIAV